MALLDQHLLDSMPNAVQVYDAGNGSLLQLTDPQSNTNVLAMKCPHFLLVLDGPNVGGIAHYPSDRPILGYDVSDAFDLVVRAEVPIRVTGALEAGQVFIQADDIYVVGMAENGARFFIELEPDSRGNVINSLRSVASVALGKIGVALKKEYKQTAG